MGDYGGFLDKQARESPSHGWAEWPIKAAAIGFWAGGATQSRTGLIGFAIRCITALLSRQMTGSFCLMNKGKLDSFPLNLEREKRLELSTYTLARYRSTN